MLNTNTLPNL